MTHTEVDTILLVDDEEDLRWVIASFLRRRGYEVREAGSADEARELFADNPSDVVISDVRMPGDNGLVLMGDLHRVDPSLPVLMISALEDVSTAVEAMKRGAYDYVTKPFDNERLLNLVERALETRRLRREVEALRSGRGRGPTTFGVSKAAAELYQKVCLIAATPSLSILVQGESGTGKEVLARTIHELSPRCNEPFVAIDCGALPEPLMESMLFGHKRGSFTGADRDRDGLFVKANGGTLFLDELGNLPQGLQSKLLRSLQEREVLPLGSEKPVSFDVRLISATNSRLEDLVERDEFRLDLYHRIVEFQIRIPPLRERPEDVEHFANLFLSQVGDELQRIPALSEAAIAALKAHQWRGNLRELRNCMRRAALLAQGHQLEAADFEFESPEECRARLSAEVQGFQEGAPLTEQVQVAAAAIEKNWIDEALAAAGGNKAEAARKLGIDYSTLHRKLKKYGIE